MSGSGSQAPVAPQGPPVTVELWQGSHPPHQQVCKTLLDRWSAKNTNVTVNNWFSGGSNQLQEITAGGLKIDSQISQLVQAMATYSASQSGFDPTSSSVSAVPNDSGLQATLASSWHA